MLIKHLKSNEKNPRRISQTKKEALKRTMAEFGDLGCIVFNTTTERLVSGHQRVSQIDGDTKVVYDKKYDIPTKQGTVAEGFVIVNGERFKYREVNWSKDKETRALLAANKSGGEWDTDILKLTLSEIKYDISNTGFEALDLKALNIEIPKLKIDDIKTSPFEAVKEESDEQYIRNTPQTSEQIPTENPNNNVFEKVEEKKMDVIGRRYVIIIDCTSAEHKEALKEKIQPLVTEAGGKFF